MMIKVLTVVIVLTLTSCSAPKTKPNFLQVAIGSTKCSKGTLYKARERWPYWVAIGKCARHNPTGSIFNRK